MASVLFAAATSVIVGLAVAIRRSQPAAGLAVPPGADTATG